MDGALWLLFDAVDRETSDVVDEQRKHGVHFYGFINVCAFVPESVTSLTPWLGGCGVRSLVGGFGRIGSISSGDYTSAEPDPVAQFSAPVCGHMNEDHADATVAMVKHYIGITVDSARMLSLDQLGVDVSCERQGQQFKARLPFPRKAENRKMIKEVIVEMTKTASGAVGK